MLQIESISRLHFTLVDMNGEHGRIDGSLGIAIQDPQFIMQFRPSDQNVIHADRATTIEIQKNIDVFNKNFRFVGGVYCKVISTIPPHSGLGSGTQTALTIGHAFSRLYNLNLSDWDIVKIMQRGGTSGLGSYMFTKGGFVLDGGHDIRDKQSFLPSGSVSNVYKTPILYHTDFPDEWEVALCIDEKSYGLSGIEEKEFMKEHCPIDTLEVDKVCRVVLTMILPALEERRFDKFSEGISILQDVGWKRYHWMRNQNKKMFVIKTIMKQIGLQGVGLSSTGNTIFGFFESQKQSKKCIEESFESEIKKNNILNLRLKFTKANNVGGKIING